MDAPPQVGKRLLVVDDDPATRAALSTILKAEGYRVDGAANGREAIDQLHDRPPPHLILLDLMMPIMDGWEFCRRQRLDPQFREIPVIVLSADGNAQLRADDLGAAGFLQKPILFDNLVDLIERCC